MSRPATAEGAAHEIIAQIVEPGGTHVQMTITALRTLIETAYNMGARDTVAAITRAAAVAEERIVR